jgi:hypothetical protein
VCHQDTFQEFDDQRTALSKSGTRTATTDIECSWFYVVRETGRSTERQFRRTRASAMIARTGGAISGTPNAIGIHQPFVSDQKHHQKNIGDDGHNAKVLPPFVISSRQHNVGEARVRTFNGRPDDASLFFDGFGVRG